MNTMNSLARMGFTWDVELVDARGHTLSHERVHNLIPDEGLNHLIGVAFKGTAQVTNWYIALFEANYTPTNALTGSTFPATATESTAYDEATRQAFQPGAAAGGSVDNGANRAQFTFNAAKTIYGGVLISTPTKGDTTGVIVSAVKFPSPKLLDVGSVLRVVAGNSLVSV